MDLTDGRYIFSQYSLSMRLAVNIGEIELIDFFTIAIQAWGMPLRSRS